MGDRERREVDEQLRAAHDEGMLSLAEYDERSRACYGATYRRELDELLADVRDDPSDERASPTVHERVPDEATTRPSRLGKRLTETAGNVVGLAVVAAVLYAILGADQGAAFFGERTVPVAPGQDEVEVGVLFGSVQVVVPEGVRAGTSGLTVFGSTDCAAACAGGVSGGPQVDVAVRGAFGSVEVLTAGEAARGVELRGDDDRDDAGDDGDDGVDDDADDGDDADGD